LTNQIASLNSIQQSILSARLSGLNIPLFADTAGGCSSDIGKSPGFSGGFGFFTYGVPNRVGLNQYGAWEELKPDRTRTPFYKLIIILTISKPATRKSMLPVVALTGPGRWMITSDVL